MLPKKKRKISRCPLKGYTLVQFKDGPAKAEDSITG